VLRDGHQPDLAGPESLQESQLLSSVTTQSVHAHDYDRVNVRTPGIQQTGDPSATRTLT
jgi:hypothetical protein